MSIEEVILIGGCERSGTTLLGSLLGNHSQCLCVPESQFKCHPLTEPGSTEDIDLAEAYQQITRQWRFQIWGIADDLSREILEGISSYAELLKKIVETYGKQVNKENARIWVDHTPDNLKHMSTLISLFPDARFIHIVRDGRAVANSMQSVSWGPHTIPRLADYWSGRVAVGLSAERKFPNDRIMRVTFEDLVRRTEETMHDISSFLNIDFEHRMTGAASFDPPDYTRDQHKLIGDPPDPSRVDSWEHELSDRDVEIFESKSGALLKHLGYTPVNGENARQMSRWEIFRTDLAELVMRQIGRLQTRFSRTNWFK